MTTSESVTAQHRILQLIRHSESSRLRQFRNALVNCLGVRGFVNPPIGEAHPDNVFERDLRTLCVVNLKARATGMAKIKFGHIAL